MTPETSIYEYAKQSLSLSPDRPAIWFRDKALSYGQLFQMIDNAAAHLAQLGVKEGSVVSIHLHNCPQAVIAVYAAAKLGAICNMVHPQMPEEAIRKYLAFAESNILISANRNIIGSVAADTSIYVDVDAPLNEGCEHTDENGKMYSFSTMIQPCKAPTVIPNQDELAGKCVVYMHSSGTTGASKTVMLSHRALNYAAENLKSHFCGDVLHEQVCLWSSPLYHALGMSIEVHRVLAYGGQLVVLERWDSDQVITYIEKYKLTYLSGIPQLYRGLLHNPRFSEADLSSVSYCIISGEPVPAELIHALDQKVGNGPVTLCAYGVTELGGAISAHSHENRIVSTAGYPLDNVQVMVMDPDGNLAPMGCGELVVSSDSLMLGYLKDPETTQKAVFSYDGKLWLRTGDYGSIDEKGLVSCLNRIKDIIIRKGNNVFPSEVEQIIRQVPGVMQTCVFGEQDEVNATETVCAAVVLRPQADAEKVSADILEECRRLLPRYAIPGKIVFVAAIPCNKMGKMDRMRLKEQI